MRGRACSYLDFVDTTLTLSDAQWLDVLTAVRALKTDRPPSDRRGADFPFRSLSVNHGDSRVPSLYSGDFYAGAAAVQRRLVRTSPRTLTAFAEVLGTIVFPPGLDAGGN
ncbi:MAG TPA: hypothetical protein VGM06_19335 [Polyangiaceae bacterium]